MSRCSHRLGLCGAALCLATVLFTAAAWAQTYPTKPVRIVVPFTPGSLTDVSTRLIAAKMTEAWGHQVIVDNRSGAGGTVGTGIVADANPDGYTLLAHSSGYAIAPALYPKWKVDMLRDFQAITTTIATPHLLVISPTLGPKNTLEFIEYARKRGDAFNWSHAGVGSSTHLVGEKFMLATKLKHTHIPFKGTPEAMIEAISGRVAVFFSPFSSALSLVKDGKALAIAVTSKERNSVLPNVPTLHESGVPDFEYNVWFVLAAPAKVPGHVIKTIHTATINALKHPDVVKTFAVTGAVPVPRTPEDAQRYMAQEIKELGTIARLANVPVN